MIRRRSTIGLALLCAFAFCAFAAQSAMAQTGTKSVNTTAVTCVKEGGDLDFEDPHCDVFVGKNKGEYGHVPITKDTTTEVDVSLASANAKLNATIAGVPTEVICKKVASVASESKLHNVETESKHTITGEVKVNFSDCEVVKPNKCKIKEPILTSATAQGVEELNGKKEMGVEFKGVGEKKEFAELFFEDKNPPEEKCALTNGGKPFIVLGSAIATSSKKLSGEPKHHSGATAVYEDANEMETLEIGTKKASFAGEFTTTMSNKGHPITLTTTT